MKAFKMFTLLLLLALLPGYAQSAVFEVAIDENGFDPVSLVIDKGDTVRWVNKGSSPHSATSWDNGVADGFFDSGLIAPGETFEQTFQLPITMGYFDRFNPYPFGFVHVRGVAISPGDSFLITNTGFNLILIISNHITGEDLQYIISIDGSPVFKGSRQDLKTAPFVKSSTLLYKSGEALVIPVEAPPSGIHTVEFAVTTTIGETVASDIATYTVLLDTSVPPPPPGAVQ